MEVMKYMKNFDFITDELLLEELNKLKKEDPRFYYELIRFIMIHNRADTEHLTNLINYQLFGE